MPRGRIEIKTGAPSNGFVVRETAAGAVLVPKKEKWTAPLRPAPETKEEEGPPLFTSTLSLDERYELCRSVAEECIQDDELRALLSKKEHPICYDGFEPSGRMHIAQGVMKALNVNKLTQAGCIFKFWVADWFAMLNHKMGGDLKKIRVVGEYMIEVWKACGMDMTNVRFLWASDDINANSHTYWSRVMDIAMKNNVSRIKRCGTIMGRDSSDSMPASQIFYPAMQCADIFHLKADICQLGMDQRKVNMLAREYCDQVKPKIKFKPIILSHHMIMGLKEGQEKMSKRDPDTAIFMEDSKADVKRKVNKAYCPPEVTEKNPVMDWMKHIILPYFGKVDIVRPEKYGGNVTYTNWEAMFADYEAGKLHPGDVKPAMIKALNDILDPVREHFSKGKPKEILKQVRKYVNDQQKAKAQQEKAAKKKAAAAAGAGAGEAAAE